MNQPDRIDKFVVPEGVKKVSYEPDTKIANAGTFTIQREDHTIGNLIRMKLHEDSRVLFAGYKIVHPLEHKVLVKVQTDGSIPPSEAFSDAIDDLGRQFSALRDNFAVRRLPAH
ncbi:unnamed protein product [Ostreobium quekettii]|uniref:DNA-directed RNA polymerase RBP11-like dimerisation domain-containing protein n=1 Tax=Ostreobium quekettii TaxID=121088 RepID=A0A8S1IPT6_9CHLO|nr:unnamed protein product [Ostreobium quekettii]